MMVNIQLSGKNVLDRNGDGYTTMVNKKFNICTFLNEPNTNDFFGNFYKHLVADKQHFMFKKCPIEPVMFFIYNFVVENANTN